MYLTLLILPLLGSKIANNRKVGTKNGPIISVICKILASICCLGIYYEVAIKGSPVYLKLGNWIDFGNILIEWSFIFDTLTVTKYLPIVLISCLIQKYSLEYKETDPHKSRFFSFLSKFCLAMLILVSGENFFLIIMGWELVGLASYLLISFWNTRISANKGAKSALFQNKIGDLTFILGLTLFLAIFGDLSLATIFSLTSHLNQDLVFILTILILITGASKSALFPLNTWLLRAKEGPTSVSALLHSSTKVKLP